MVNTLTNYSLWTTLSLCWPNMASLVSDLTVKFLILLIACTGIALP